PQPAVLGGMALDSQPRLSRHGRLLRCRQGRRPRRGSQLPGHEAGRRYRCPLPQSARDAAPYRRGLGQRRHEPGVFRGGRVLSVERLLSPIAEVRRQEVASALLMTLLVFLLLAAYYLLKTARE